MIKNTYYCDCYKAKSGKIIRKNMHETEVYEDSACIDCGHYAKVKTERIRIEPDGVVLEDLSFQSKPRKSKLNGTPKK